MPFVTREHRLNPDPSIPGDLCYQYYFWILSKWKANPRWTTAHDIYKEIVHIRTTAQTTDRAAALDLAWQVFFVRELMPYEEMKAKENGEI